MSNSQGKMGVEIEVSPEDLEALKQVQDRLEAAGICKTLIAMQGVLIGTLLRQLGPAETSMVFYDWIYALTGLEGMVYAGDKAEVVTTGKRRGRKS